MTIGFFSPKPFSITLGATKNRIEFSDELKKLGWKTYLIDNKQIGLSSGQVEPDVYRNALKEFLIQNAQQFDVVMYEYDSLPFNRSLFSDNTLFVARPALLGFNFENISIPYDLKTQFAKITKKVLRYSLSASFKSKADIRDVSLTQSDLIQVQNNLDKDLLINRGYNPNKIIVVPNGITEERRKLFGRIKREYSSVAKIAYVGTFDYRKGALDFPYIVNKVNKVFPGVKFKLLGTKGLFSSAKQILSFFPERYQAQIEVIPEFDPIELPDLLSDCHLGVFPSYIESFGFGALEMMSAGLPVVSYNCPGPSDFIIKDLLVKIGDKVSMSNKLIDLLGNKEKLILLSSEATKISDNYNWFDIASRASVLYQERFKGVKGVFE